MPADDNAEDDASSVDAFEEAPSSPQEQPDTDGVPTAEADASSGGESPGLNRCSAHRLEVSA